MRGNIGNVRGFELLGTLEDKTAIEVGAEDAGAADVINGAGQQVGVEDDEIGLFAGLEGTDSILGQHGVSGVDGIESNGLLTVQSFLGVEASIVPFGTAGESGPDTQKGIVWINRAQ